MVKKMDDERKEELNQEDRENNSHYSDWLSDNKDRLIDDFIDENPTLFIKFCSERYSHRGD